MFMFFFQCSLSVGVAGVQDACDCTKAYCIKQPDVHMFP